MPFNRTAVRNVFIYNRATGTCLGGLRQNGSVTEAVFLWILNNILFLVSSSSSEDAEISIHAQARATQRVVSPTSNPLEAGDIILDPNPIELTDEPWIQRIFSRSVSSGGREEDRFRLGLRARDGRCVLSGVVNLNAEMGDWSLFESAHVFPLEKESLWTRDDFGRWITDDDDDDDDDMDLDMDHASNISKIHSCQNGLLLRRDLHTMFDSYLISVNPDDGYKITVFNYDILGLDGRILDPVCRDPADPHRVSDEILRWHFRQSVLANMRGAGEPIFEHDFPPGTDMMRDIQDEPRGQERFEMEIALRLRGGGHGDG
ncbi:hypothetical protein L228DRAFT_258695 [Xylona heveae TC161]|uniref:Uncharacterized protein n=1 Tax=Xylona heveae (strain CBS 132557 / TC161) TaxID=1328760 RepID=A0A165IQM6_XYLHT|nr:hypothetical protein L228DRAFT_258695 [Xylona heveae TC161]KZF25242.1 hypothetical protein L228DRAFT_258695 [Xylona heveae TC161]